MTTYTTYHVLVPKDGTPAAQQIMPGSGIVCADLSGPQVEVYYEGNRYGTSALRSFEAKLLHAAGRLQARYPTIAMGVWARSQFEVVGKYSVSEDWRDCRLEVTNGEALRLWAPDVKHR